MFVAVLFLLLLTWSAINVEAIPPFNNPPSVDIWCGKAYRESNSSFDPGGWLYPPKGLDQAPKLDLRVYSRYNYYLASESTGSFVIDTPIQTIIGGAYKNETYELSDPGKKVPFTHLDIRIAGSQTHNVLVDWTRVPVNASGIEIPFSLKSVLPNARHPWTVNIVGNSPDGIQTYYSGASVWILPDLNGTGSVARIDRLFGGIEVKSVLTKGQWRSIFPFSFYTSWDWISSTINNDSTATNLSTFRQHGFNIIHPIPPGGVDPFNHTVFEDFLRICDELELYVMYDMRHTYQNLTSISDQLSRLQHHPSLLLYYTADEPDGACDPLNATANAYDHIRSIDPYHPVSLVLNCANFYFGEYSSGADIILEDTYPVNVNTTFSTVYHTACNITYGDCGCDNCHAGDLAYPEFARNEFLDVVERTESMYRFQEWIGSSYRKPVWGVPQAFFDQGSFWDAWPTASDVIVMSMVRVNHGSKGIVAWSYPTSEAIDNGIASLAQVVTSDEVTRFTLGALRLSDLKVTGGEDLVDAVAWIRQNTSGTAEMLVSYVFQGYTPAEQIVEIVLPHKVQVEITELYGAASWDALVGWKVKEGDDKTITKSKLGALEVGILKFNLKE